MQEGLKEWGTLREVAVRREVSCVCGVCVCVSVCASRLGMCCQCFRNVLESV